MEQDKNIHFCIFLKKAMLKRKITQADLAELANVSQGAISRYLNGKASPKAEELYRISQSLGVSMETLLTGDDSPAPASGGAADMMLDRAETAEAKLRGLRAEIEAAMKKFK